MQPIINFVKTDYVYLGFVNEILYIRLLSGPLRGVEVDISDMKDDVDGNISYAVDISHIPSDAKYTQDQLLNDNHLLFHNRVAYCINDTMKQVVQELERVRNSR